MEQILITYYADNAKNLHRMVDKILLKFGGLSDKDMDDFYSLANEVFVDVIKRYNPLQSFDGFLYSCLLNKIKTVAYISNQSTETKRNREKRKIERISISIDMPLPDDENVTLKEVIADCFDLERELLEEQEECYSKKMLLYLSKLSDLQKEVLNCMVAGYSPYEVKKKLHISEKQYLDCNQAIHSYRNISLLF